MHNRAAAPHTHRPTHIVPFALSHTSSHSHCLYHITNLRYKRDHYTLTASAIPHTSCRVYSLPNPIPNPDPNLNLNPNPHPNPHPNSNPNLSQGVHPNPEENDRDKQPAADGWKLCSTSVSYDETRSWPWIGAHLQWLSGYAAYMLCIALRETYCRTAPVFS